MVALPFPWPPTSPLAIAGVAARLYRAPLERPVRTAFGIMRTRPALLVRLEDHDRIAGWGEIWCNFPACGAEHRQRLLQDVVAPLLQAETFASPPAAFAQLSAATRILALQAGEPGPLAQVIAGVDLALWDLAARRAGQPLWRWLGGTGDGRVPAYASGIGPEDALEQAQAARAAGFTAFKLKLGFGRARDLANVRALRESLGGDVLLALDANQAWDLDEAVAMSRALAPFDPLWLEEPLAVDRPPAAWQALAEASPIPLAGGENLRGTDAFAAAIEAGALAVIQPDPAKWGGLSGCLPVARAALAAGRRFCPHYLGGAFGLAAAAHLLAAAGGDGLLEIDCNPNPLREDLAGPAPLIAAGGYCLTERAGFGIEPAHSCERFVAGRSDDANEGPR